MFFRIEFTMKKIIVLLLLYIIFPNNLYSKQNDKIDTEKQNTISNLAQALQEAFEKEKEKIIENNNRNEISDYSLSDTIIRIGSLEETVQNQVTVRRNAINKIIMKCAESLYHNRHFKLSQKGGAISIELLEENESKQVVKHIHSSNLSIYSLLIALELIANVSEYIRKDAIDEKDPTFQFDKYLNHTIIVHELSVIAIQILKKFKHVGSTELIQLSDDQISYIEKAKQRSEDRLKKFKDDFANDKLTKNEYELFRINDREMIKKYNAKIIPIWALIKNNVQKKDETISKLNNNIFKLEYKREQAHDLIEFFSRIKIAKAAKEKLNKSLNIAEMIISIPLLIPNPEEIDLFFNIKDNNIDEIDTINKFIEGNNGKKIEILDD